MDLVGRVNFWRPPFWQYSLYRLFRCGRSRLRIHPHLSSRGCIDGWASESCSVSPQPAKEKKRKKLRSLGWDLLRALHLECSPNTAVVGSFLIGECPVASVSFFCGARGGWGQFRSGVPSSFPVRFVSWHEGEEAKSDEPSLQVFRLAPRSLLFGLWVQTYTLWSCSSTRRKRRQARRLRVMARRAHCLFTSCFSTAGPHRY